MMAGGNPTLDTTIRNRAGDLFGSDRTPIAASLSRDRDDYPPYKVFCARRGPGNGDFEFFSERSRAGAPIWGTLIDRQLESVLMRSGQHDGDAYRLARIGR